MVVSIQYMRALAAIFVLLHHVVHKSSQYIDGSSNWLIIGPAGVDLFFIISGYIMCYATYNKNIKVTRFLRSRMIRIIPLYWALTSLALIGSSTLVYGNLVLLFTA